MTNNFLKLYGITNMDELDELDVEAGWQGKSVASPLLVPIGFDGSGEVVSLDFSRFDSLDDHVLIVGSPGAGMTNLIQTISLGLAITRRHDDLSQLIVTGTGGVEYKGFDRLPNCAVTDTCSDDAWDIWRLSCWLQGEVDGREAALAESAATDISEYRRRTPAEPDQPGPYPELVYLFDDAAFLVDSADFNSVYENICKSGHRLGLRLVVGIPWATWKTVTAAHSDYFEGLTARIALGLTAVQSSALFGTDVPDDLVRPGQAYLHTTQGGLVKLTNPYGGELMRRYNI